MSSLEIRTNMTDAANTIEQTRKRLRAVKLEAEGTDAAINKTAKGPAAMLNTAFGKMQSGAQQLNTALQRTGSILGISLGAAAAISKVFAEINRQAEKMKEGAQGIVGDVASEATLRMMAKEGVVPADVLNQVDKLRRENARKGISLTGGEYTEAAATLGEASGLRGADLIEAMKAAMEIWARSGMKGTLGESAQTLAMVLGTGQTRALRKQGVYLDETQFEGMEGDDRAKAIFAALSKKLSGASALDELLKSRDPRAQLLVSQINERTARSEFGEGRAFDNARMMALAAQMRADAFNRGIDPESFFNWSTWIRQKTLDPSSGGIGALARAIDAASGGKTSYYETAKRAALEIETRPPVREGTK